VKKTIAKRARAGSNVSAKSAASNGKAQKTSEKAKVPQKKKKVESSSDDSSSEEEVKVIAPKKKAAAKKESSSDSDSSSDESEKPAPKKKAAAKKDAKMSSDSDDSSDESSAESEKPAPKKKAAAKKESSSDSGSSSDESEKPAPKKKAAKKEASSDDDSSSSSDEEPKPRSRKQSAVSAKSAKSDKKKKAKDSSSSSDDEKAENGAEVAEVAGDFGECPAEHAGKTELFAQSLSHDTTEDGLRAFFKPYGELTKVKLLWGKGKAFIEFGDHASAWKALNSTNEKVLDGFTIWVEFSGQAAGGYKPSGEGGADPTTVFVGNLGFRTERWAIEEFFKSAGAPTDVRIAMDPETERPRGFAHVEFATHEEAKEAMKLAGQELDGRAIRLDLSASK